MPDPTAITAGGTQGLLIALVIAVGGMAGALAWMTKALINVHKDLAKAREETLTVVQTMVADNAKEFRELHKSYGEANAKVQEARVDEMKHITEAARSLTDATETFIKNAGGRNTGGRG